jgi:SPP1 family predicted phage head-tail adaptor
MVLACGKYNAGQLTKAVAFQRVTRAPDGVGGWSETWAAIAGAPTRAHVRQLSGGETWRFDRINAEVSLMIVTRYNASVTPADRVIFQGRAHNIREVRNVDFADKWLEIAVTGGVAV